MAKSWYQINWYDQDKSVSAGYKMVQSTSLDNALKEFFGADYSDMTIDKKGTERLISCPAETTRTWSAWKAR
jgi:hypothetical protein